MLALFDIVVAFVFFVSLQIIEMEIDVEGFAQNFCYW